MTFVLLHRADSNEQVLVNLDLVISVGQADRGGSELVIGREYSIYVREAFYHVMDPVEKASAKAKRTVVDEFLGMSKEQYAEWLRSLNAC